ncbi:LOW QUALITY PROTEIN: butyrophilin subfamily 3 member A1-like [Narcine bancroftii]|uniref:LOW QUALITY PROTEIN: butyrophilin subfamily 3 member A1-like n=1 Tax=Narcine bancroftii TaxID=1343680 RepID=UPI003831E220
MESRLFPLFILYGFVHHQVEGLELHCSRIPIVTYVGSQVVLECQAVPLIDVEGKEIRWTKDKALVHLYRFGHDENDQQHPSFQGRTQLFKNQFHKGNVSLLLQSVILSDLGTYRCFVEILPEVNDDSDIDLQVLSIGLQASISLHRYTSNGIELTCDSQLWFPEPVVEWKGSRGEDLSNKSTITTVKDSKGFYNVRSIIEVTGDSRNHYNCLMGSKEMNPLSATLEVAGKNRKEDIYLNGICLGKGEMQQDLGVAVHQPLKVGLQVQQVVRKANGMLAFIARGFELVPLFKIQNAWEQDLNLSLPDEQFKVVHRTHMSKVKWSRFYSDTNPLCDKCKAGDASLVLMFWICPDLAEFWKDVFEHYRLLNDLDVPASTTTLDKAFQAPTTFTSLENPKTQQSRGWAVIFLDSEASFMRRRESLLELGREECAHTTEPSSRLCHIYSAHAFGHSNVSMRYDVRLLHHRLKLEVHLLGSKPIPAIEARAVRSHSKSLKNKLGEQYNSLAAIRVLPQAAIKRITSTAASVTLDRDTAHPNLKISPNLKTVTYVAERVNTVKRSKRFDSMLAVMGVEGLSSGRHYWEVEVKSNSEWDLGVALDRVERQGNNHLDPDKGFWTIGFHAKRFQVNDVKDSFISMNPDVQAAIKMIGIYVNYSEGKVQFYNAKTYSHLHTFQKCHFGEVIFPFFKLTNLGTSLKIH